MSNFINSPMQEALKQAQLAYAQDEVPVGAVITLNNKIIASASNAMHTRKNPLAHAEILVIEKTLKILQTNNLYDCNLYVTLEPCTMCAAAIAYSRIKRLYYGAQDIKGGAIENGIRFFSQPQCHHKLEIYPAMMEQPCADLLINFFKNKRQK